MAKTKNQTFPASVGPDGLQWRKDSQEQARANGIDCPARSGPDSPRRWGGTPELGYRVKTGDTPFTNRFTQSANSHYAIKQLKTLLCNGYKSAARSTQQKNSYSVGSSYLSRFRVNRER
jgi:hypothetical protein